jgi:oligopeptide/dipeptide ABC transporter ATP-binding protein
MSEVTKGLTTPEPGIAVSARDAVRQPNSTGALLEVRDLSVTFELPHGDLHALDGVSLSVERGTMLGIAGESGSGKSVMARALMGLLPAAITDVKGSISFEGEELVGRSNKEYRRFRGSAISIVFQDPMRSFNPIKTVGEQVAEALRSSEGMSRGQARSRTIEMLDLVRIPNPKERFSNYPHQLSGGMRQRVMIAMALARHPRLLIADEPTTALDVTTQVTIMELIRDLQAELGMAVIFITHDLNLAATYTDEVAVMYSGRIVERVKSKDVLRALRMPYAKALIESIPSLEEPPHSMLRAILGTRPDPLALPQGCSFHPRCEYCTARCESEEPQLLEGSPGHWWACWNPLPEGEG